jgi:hypothetical protein
MTNRLRSRPVGDSLGVKDRSIIAPARAGCTENADESAKAASDEFPVSLNSEFDRAGDPGTQNTKTVRNMRAVDAVIR